MAQTYTNKDDTTKPSAVPCRSRYERLQIEREPYLRRARDVAALTLPAIMPPEGHTGSLDLATPFQSAGADGMNSLAAKLLLALIPPGASFFRLEIDPKVKEELLAASKQSGEDVFGEVQAQLGKQESAVLKRLESTGARIGFFDALKHLLIAGNALVQIRADSSIRLHYLDHYVCKRDPAGNVLEIIVHEKIAREALPEKAQALLADVSSDDEEAKQDSVSVYTRVIRESLRYRVYQEVCGKEVPDSEGFYPLDKSAWLPLRYTRVDGEDYGRGRGEEYLGDLQSLEALTQSLVEGTAISTRILFLISESGITSAQALQDAANGAVVEGDLRDIGILKVDKFNDFTIAAQTAKALEDRLNKAFLVQQQRQAERVTAEEVRAVITELEKQLGGAYAILAQEFQLPVVKRIIAQMQRSGDLPRISEKFASPTIITGLEALGRGADFEKLRMFISDTAQEFGPQAVAEYVNVGAYMRRKATALQIDIDGIVRTEQEVQATRQQQRQAEMMAKLGPAAMRAETDQSKINAAAASAQQPETA